MIKPTSLGVALAGAFMLLLACLVVPAATKPVAAFTQSPALRSVAFQPARPRRVPIRRTPSRRAIRVVTVASGGGAPETCLWPAGEPASDVPAYALSHGGMHENFTFAGFVYLPDASEIAYYASVVPLVCANLTVPGEAATAISPDGRRMPALVVPGESPGHIYVSLPLDAYLQPGVWRLEIAAGEGFDTEIVVPQPETPAAIVGGDQILLGGYQPLERVKGIVLNNQGFSQWTAEGEPVCTPDPATGEECPPDWTKGDFGTLWTYGGEFDLQTDERGYVVLDKPDYTQLDASAEATAALPVGANKHALVFVGEQTSGYMPDPILGEAVKRAVARGIAAFDAATWFSRRGVAGAGRRPGAGS